MANTRDPGGRWIKGVSGNPKGRPTNVSKVDFGDFERFSNTMVTVDSKWGKRFLTRQAAVQERLYASAMKGNVQAQIFLMRKFEERTERIADLEHRFSGLRHELNTQKTPPTQQQMDSLAEGAAVLGFVPQPGRKVKIRRSRAKNKNAGEPAADGPKPPSFMKEPLK